MTTPAAMAARPAPIPTLRRHLYCQAGPAGATCPRSLFTHHDSGLPGWPHHHFFMDVHGGLAVGRRVGVGGGGGVGGVGGRGVLLSWRGLGLTLIRWLKLNIGIYSGV